MGNIIEITILQDIYNRISSFMTFFITIVPFFSSQRFFPFSSSCSCYLRFLLLFLYYYFFFGHKSFVIYIHYCRHYVNYFVEKVSNNIKVFKVPYYFVLFCCCFPTYRIYILLYIIFWLLLCLFGKMVKTTAMPSIIYSFGCGGFSVSTENCALLLMLLSK